MPRSRATTGADTMFTVPSIGWRTPDKAADVAFKLYDRWLLKLKDPEMEMQMDPDDDDDKSKAGGDETKDEFSWQTANEILPSDLNTVMLQMQSGDILLEPRSLLDSVPQWRGMKQRAD